MEMMIGSQAIQFTPEQIRGTIWEVFQSRINKSDWDIATDEELFRFEIRGSQRYEYHPMKELFTGEYRESSINDILYTIKLSHAIYDINFTKTMWDIAFLNFLGAKRIDGLFEKLALKWVGVHKRHHRGFNFPYDELFEDNVERLIPHNTLHVLISMAVRGSPLPMWEELKARGVLNSLSEVTYEERFWVNVEEALVFTFERHYVSCINGGVQYAYVQSLRDLITRCSPVSEGYWMAENYQAIRTLSPEIFNSIHNLIYTIYGKYNNSGMARIGKQIQLGRGRSGKTILQG